MPELIRVLLVDDNAAMLDRAAAVLAPTCAIVGAVTDGPTALEAARTLQPDVIVLDISMPGMSGLDVAQSLKAVGSTAAVVFLTVHDDAEVMAAAKAAGGIRYVMKPRLVVDLARAVREASSGRPFESTIP